MRRPRSTKNDVSSLSNGIVRERPNEDSNCVSIISSGVVNVSFDDIDDMNMIDSGSVATVNDDEDNEVEAIDVAFKKKDVSIERSVSFKDEVQENEESAAVAVREDSDHSLKLTLDHQHGPKLFSCSKDCFGTKLSV